jgi:hypothetical protein
MHAVAEAGYRAIAPDPRGYGDTEADEEPRASTSVDVMGDLVAILDHLQVDDVTLVAHDILGKWSNPTKQPGHGEPPAGQGNGKWSWTRPAKSNHRTNRASEKNDIHDGILA